VKAILNRAYVDNVSVPRPFPSMIVPTLLDYARPVHEVVPVDVFVPGCPPSADTIYQVLDDLLSGRTPAVAGTRFGA